MALPFLSPLPVTLPMPPPHVASKFMTYSLVNVFMSILLYVWKYNLPSPLSVACVCRCLGLTTWDWITYHDAQP